MPLTAHGNRFHDIVLREHDLPLNRPVHHIVPRYRLGFVVFVRHLLLNHLAKRLGTTLDARIHATGTSDRRSFQHNVLSPVPDLFDRYDTRARNHLSHQFGLHTGDHLCHHCALRARRGRRRTGCHALRRADNPREKNQCYNNRNHNPFHGGPH